MLINRLLVLVVISSKSGPPANKSGGMNRQKVMFGLWPSTVALVGAKSGTGRMKLGEFT
jgi:hypothetical protein